MDKIEYSKLNARQKETFNFQKVSAVLADYGFATIKLNDDWQGADFIAQHIDGETYLKIQLKARLTLAKKYCGKELYVCFPHKEEWYLYSHDSLLQDFTERFSESMIKSKSWVEGGVYTWKHLSKEIEQLLIPMKL